jgi:hypothetical protein
MSAHHSKNTSSLSEYQLTSSLTKNNGKIKVNIESYETFTKRFKYMYSFRKETRDYSKLGVKPWNFTVINSTNSTVTWLGIKMDLKNIV